MNTSKWFFIALASILSVSFFSFSQNANASQTTVIFNVNVLDPEKEVIKPHQLVVISGGVFQKVISLSSADQESLKRDSSVTLIDGTGKYLTPGLIDAHVHVDLYHWEQKADDWSLPLYIANGVTSVRDAAGSSITLQLRKDIEAGKRIGPRMVIASPFLTSSKVSGDSNEFQVTTASEATAMGKKLLDLGYDGVKVDSMLNLESYHALSDFLASKGSYLFGHSLYGNSKGYWEVLLDEVVDHYHSIEHIGFICDFLQAETSPYYHKVLKNPGVLDWQTPAYIDFAKVPALAKLLKAKDETVSPTLVTIDYQLRLDTDSAPFQAAGLNGFRTGALSQYLPDYYYDTWLTQYKTWGYGINNPLRQELVTGLVNEKKLIKLLDDANVRIIAGTDAPARPNIVAGFSLHDELADYVSGGMSNWRTLRTATVNAAETLNKRGKIGIIQDNAYADFVLTQKNPIEDLSVLRRPDAVMAKGHYYSANALAKMLDDEKKLVRSMTNSFAKNQMKQFHSDLPPTIAHGSGPSK